VTVGGVGYYVRLIGVSIRTSLITSMQYRVDFVIQGVMSLLWTALAIFPLLVLYGDRTSVAGWDFGSALVVMGLFTIMRGVLEGAINPSLLAVVERIRSGSFDYTLLKPADAQFLVSTTRFDPWHVTDLLAGIGIIVYAFVEMGRAPGAGELAAALALAAAAVAVMYSLWILIVASAFWVVRMDNLSFLLGAVFDAARWPIHVFRGTWRFVFTFIIPLALMTSYPAMALLGTLSLRAALLSLAGSAAFFLLSRTVWTLAIRSYTSASS
jgi:ABC-2 type transport system permease protein